MRVLMLLEEFLVGKDDTEEQLNYCYNGGKLIAIGGIQYIGGIIGSIGGVNNHFLNCCYNVGDIRLSDTKLQVFCGGIVGSSSNFNSMNCHSKCKIFTENLDYEKNKIGLFVGYADSSEELTCSSRNCSVLKYDNLPAFKDFDGEEKDILLKTDEKDMVSILEVLGGEFKNGSNGYPILKWQAENN